MALYKSIVIIIIIIFFMPSPPDNVGEGVMFSGCPVCLDKSCYHDVSVNGFSNLDEIYKE